MFRIDFGSGQSLRVDTTYPRSKPVPDDQVIEISDAQSKESVRLLVKEDRKGWEHLRVTWMVIDQLDSMIVDPSVLGKFGSQVRREREVGILDGNLCKSD